MTALRSLERQKAQEIAAQYRKGNYEVIADPAPEQLPDFLKGFCPDLLVRIGDYAKVIEVKSRASLVKTQGEVGLARVLADKPNWGHELFLVGRAEHLQLAADALAFGRDAVLQNLAKSKSLLAAELPEAALLVSWAALEATVRLRNRLAGIPPDFITAPALLSLAVYHGALSGKDYQSLLAIMDYRNAAAHGFSTESFDQAIVRQLNRMVRRLLPSEPALERFDRNAAKAGPGD